MICSVCQSSSFYEDHLGDMCCVVCGTQSQDYIAQSQEIDDAIAFDGEKTVWKSKKKVSRRKKLKGRTQFTNLDYLLACQKCLQLLVEALPLKSDEFSNQVRSFWVNFLFSFTLFHYYY